MLLVSSSLKPSLVHGLGCFTNEDSKKGQIVWQLDQRTDIVIPFNELQLLPESAQEFLGVYGYTKIHEGVKTIILCGDHAKHMNHNSDPNLLEGSGLLDINVAT